MKACVRPAGIGRQMVLLLIAVVATCGLSPSVDSSEVQREHRLSSLGQNRYRDRVFDDVELQEKIVYRSLAKDGRNGEDLRLDVYLPAGDAERSRPAILWIHGGGVPEGETRKQGYIVSLATEFAKRGYVSVVPDYRLHLRPGAGWKETLLEAVDDCRAALEWMRSHSHAYRINPQWIALGGGSAGGMIAVNVASTENTAAAQTGRRGLFGLIDLWGSPPLFYVLGEISTHFPPTVIIHGTQDTAVPFAQSELFAAKLKEVGVDHLLHPIPNAPHTPTSHMAEIIETSSQFLYAILTKGIQR